MTLVERSRSFCDARHSYTRATWKIGLFVFAVPAPIEEDGPIPGSNLKVESAGKAEAVMVTGKYPRKTVEPFDIGGFRSLSVQKPSVDRCLD
jgi:hypothetical protein